MKCLNCGTESRDGEKFCPECGQKLPRKSFGGVVSVLVKVLLCTLIMLICQGCVASFYETSVMLKDPAYVAAVTSAAVEMQSGASAEEVAESLTNDIQSLTARAAEKTLERLSSVTIVGNLVALLVLLLVLRLRKHEPLKYLRVKLVNPARILSFLLFGAALSLVVGAVMSLIPFSDKIIKEYNDMSLTALCKDSLTVQIICTVFIAPVIEELIFRGFAVPHLKQVIGKAGAVVVSSLFFASVHFALTTASLISVGYAFVVGIVFALAFIRYDSVIPSLLFHIGFNAMNFVKFNENGTVPYAVVMLGFLISALLEYRIFFRYPTFSDVVFAPSSIEPKDEEEARIISRIAEIRSGDDDYYTEEIEELSRDWDEHFRALHGTVSLHATVIVKADQTDDESNNENDTTPKEQ